MDPILLIGRYPFRHWVLGARPGGIESYRPLPQLGVLPCDRGNSGGSPWLLRFVTPAALDIPSTLIILRGFGSSLIGSLFRCA